MLFIEYITRVFDPIRDLSAKYAVMQGAMAASEHIFQLLDTDENDGDVDGKPVVMHRPRPISPDRRWRSL